MHEGVRRATARIGFQVYDDGWRHVTGYCAAWLAVDQANARGDLPFAVELVPIIDGKDRRRAREAAAAFAADPAAIGVLGPLNSDMALAVQDIYADAGFAQLTSEASSPLLTRGGYKNFFRLVPNDEVQGPALAQAAVGYLRANRIAVLHDSSGWGRPIAELFSAEATSLGREPVLLRGFGEREHALAFDAMVSETIAAKPDLVYFAVYWHTAHIVAHKLRYAGCDATFLGSDALKPFAFLEVPRLDKVKPYHSLAGMDIRHAPHANSFVRDFVGRFPDLMLAPQYAGEAYDCAGILLEAARRAGVPERRRILAEVQRIGAYEGVCGTVSFDERGDRKDPVILLYQCDGGQRHYLGRIADLVAAARDGSGADGILERR